MGNNNIVLKLLKKRELFFISIILIIGAASEPLIAYSYTFISDHISKLNIQIYSLRSLIFLLSIALLLAGINYVYKGYISNEIVFRLRKRLFSSILKKPVQEFGKNDSGEYINTITRKADIWQYNYFNNILQCFEQTLEILFILIIFIKINKFAFLTMILFLVPLLINNIAFPKFIKRHYGDYFKNENEVIVKMKEYLLGFESIKLACGEKIFSERMNQTFNKSKTSHQWVDFLCNLSANFANIGVTISKVSGIIVGVLLLSKNQISFGNFLTIFQLSAILNEPVVRLINATVGLQSVKDIKNQLHNDIRDLYCKSTNLKENDLNMLNEITLKHIFYRYANQEHYLFNDINFKFTSNKKYLIIGESGSGKSTLIKLLLKQLDGYSGDVLYNGVKSNDVSCEYVYSNISYTPQNVFIFNGSIRDNIDLLHCYDDDRVNHIVDVAKLNKLIMSKDLGIESIINEEVFKVSGGERSRLGLARALISNKNIIIIDEILSALDSTNAYNIENDILGINNKMIIHIAHKSNKELMCKYDYILELKEGKLIQQK